MNKIYALSTLLNGKITHLVHTPNASECDDPDSEMLWGLKSVVRDLTDVVTELTEITQTLIIKTTTTSCQCGSCETVFDYTQIMNDEVKECPNCHSGNWVFGSIDNA